MSLAWRNCHGQNDRDMAEHGLYKSILNLLLRHVSPDSVAIFFGPFFLQQNTIP